MNRDRTRHVFRRRRFQCQLQFRAAAAAADRNRSQLAAAGAYFTSARSQCRCAGFSPRVLTVSPAARRVSVDHGILPQVHDYVTAAPGAFADAERETCSSDFNPTEPRIINHGS